jgi:hypothetical protein
MSTVLVEAAEPASRAFVPATSGFTDSGSIADRYEVFGEGARTLLLLPPCAIGPRDSGGFRFHTSHDTSA